MFVIIDQIVCAQEAELSAQASGGTIEQLEQQLETSDRQLQEARNNLQVTSTQLSASQAELKALRKDLQAREAQASRESIYADARLASETAAEVESGRGVKAVDGDALSELEALRSENAALQASVNALNRLKAKSGSSQARAFPGCHPCPATPILRHFTAYRLIPAVPF